MFERADAVGNFVRKSFNERKEEISAAHNFGHVQRVAEYAPLIVLQLGGTEREAEIAKASAYLHDFYRSPNESVDDELYSAEKAEPILRGMTFKGKSAFSEAEVHEILLAMKTHSVPKTLLAREDRHDRIFKGIDLVRFAVFAADKFEQNGAFIMARRSQYVGGERFLEGDLSKLKKALPSKTSQKLTPVTAILMEFYVRMGKKNRQDAYPAWFRPVVDGLFALQKEFYYSLLKAQGMYEEDLARLLKETGFPAITAQEIDSCEKRRGDSRQLIDSKSDEQVQAALEIVHYFSSPKTMKIDSAEAIANFKPKNPVAKRWKAEMQAYLKGGADALLKPLAKK